MSVRLTSALCAALIAIATPATAHDYRYDDGHGKKHGEYHQPQGHSKHYKAKPPVAWKHGYYAVPPGHYRAPVYYYSYRPVPPHRHRHTTVYRYRQDNDLLYAILALQIVDLLNDNQRESYAWAQNRAVAAPLGESIRWNDGNASGSVMAVRDGTDNGGRYCREFQHDITVGGRTQEGYGVACRQPDGSWQIVS